MTELYAKYKRVPRNTEAVFEDENTYSKHWNLLGTRGLIYSPSEKNQNLLRWLRHFSHFFALN